jgi:spore germination cell wall hydrolase CwlJ-like protein
MQIQGTLETVMEMARVVMASLSLSYEIETGKTQNEAELYCMAKNIYFESRAEGYIGKISVAHVVMNRVADDRFPNTVCEVVHQGPLRESWKTKKDPTLAKEDRVFYPRRDRCQFSWWCDGERDMLWVTYKDGRVIQNNMNAWRDSIRVALSVMNENGHDPSDGALYYYNYHIASPAWGETFKETVIFGNHRFMTDKGAQ